MPDPSSSHKQRAARDDPSVAGTATPPAPAGLTSAERPADRPRARRPADRSIAGNAWLSLLNQLVGAAFTGGLTIFLARRLGSHGYGVLSLALGVAGLVLLPTDFGVSASVARFVADHRRDQKRIQAVLADGLRIKLVATTLMVVILFALAPTIAGWYHAPALIWPIRGLAVSLFGQSFMQMYVLFTTLRRTQLQVVTSLIESSVQVCATVALVLVGAGATGAAFGQAIGYLVGGALTIALLAGTLGSGILPRGLRFGPHVRTIVGYAGVLLIVDGAYTIFSYVDALVIGQYVSLAAVALFTAPIQITLFLGYPAMAITSGVAPRMSLRGEQGPNVAAFLGGLRLLMIVQSVLTAIVIGWAPLIIKITLGPRYAGAVPVLRALAPFVFLLGFGTLVSLSANYLGEARRRVPVAIATVILNVVIDMLLVPRVGVIGGAWGTDVAYALYAPAQLWICQQVLWLDLRAFVRTFVRSIVAAALLAEMLLLFGDSVASVPHALGTLAGGAGGLAVYLLVLFLTGEITRAEVNRARRMVAARLGRAPRERA